MSDAQMLEQYVETWRVAVGDFVRLTRELPKDTWHLPTDLPGWDVKDTVAHTAHLEAVLAGAPEETLEVEESAHIRNLTGLYTEQGVIARRERTMTELAEEIESAAATRLAALRAEPPTDGGAAPPRTPGGVPWDNATLLSNRPLDVWMHEQDIRRAVDRPGGFDSPAAAHTVAVFARALPMVLGKRVGAEPGTSVVIELDDASHRFGAIVGEDGRAAAGAPDDPDAEITLSTEDFVALAGGRRGPDQTAPRIDGDQRLGRAVLESLAVTP